MHTKIIKNTFIKNYNERLYKPKNMIKINKYFDLIIQVQFNFI